METRNSYHKKVREDNTKLQAIPEYTRVDLFGQLFLPSLNSRSLPNVKEPNIATWLEKVEIFMAI